MVNGLNTCPHCQRPLAKWEPCAESGWDCDLYYCDNDECPYFVRGRQIICENYEKNFAYRYCLNPGTGQETPIVAWCGGDLSLLKGRCA